MGAPGSMDAIPPPCRRRRIGVLTSLFPSPARPREGIFALRRYLGLLARGHSIAVVQPTPRVPWPLASLAPRRFGDLAARPREENREGLSIKRPRYTHVSGLAMGNARRFAQAGVRALHASGPLDIVICDYAWPAALAVPRLRAQGLPCLISGRGSDILEVAGEAGLAAPLTKALRAASGYCAVSQDLVNAMNQLAGETHGVLVPNGVDTELFHSRPTGDIESHPERDALGWGPGPHILVVGHLIARKDPLLALAAFAELHNTNPAARCWFVGQGDQAEVLQRAIHERGLAQAVTLLGERGPADLAQLYRAADVLLLTSRREGRPNVVLEALASGLPVVATDAGGTAELLAAGPLDVVASREPAALARALDVVLRQPPRPEVLIASVQGLSWGRGLETLEALIERSLAT